MGLEVVRVSRHHHEGPTVGVADLPRERVEGDEVVALIVVDVENQADHRPRQFLLGDSQRDRVPHPDTLIHGDLVVE